MSRDAAIRVRTRSGDEILQSWIAQTSKLYSCLYPKDYGDDLEAYIIVEGGQLAQLETTADCMYRCALYLSHFAKVQRQTRSLSYLQRKRPAPSCALVVDDCPRYQLSDQYD